MRDAAICKWLLEEAWRECSPGYLTYLVHWSYALDKDEKCNPIRMRFIFGIGIRIRIRIRIRLRIWIGIGFSPPRSLMKDHADAVADADADDDRREEQTETGSERGKSLWEAALKQAFHGAARWPAQADPKLLRYDNILTKFEDRIGNEQRRRASEDTFLCWGFVSIFKHCQTFGREVKLLKVHPSINASFNARVCPFRQLIQIKQVSGPAAAAAAGGSRQRQVISATAGNR